MAKIIKTYESFMSKGKYKFEENVIDPILILIRDNQEYLKQNLSQLAKLGYKSWNKIANFNIDERGFNILSLNSSNNIEISKWIIEEFQNMKSSDPAYGTYDNQNRDSNKSGKKNLYAHDFFLWLKQNQE